MDKQKNLRLSLPPKIDEMLDVICDADKRSHTKEIHFLIEEHYEKIQSTQKQQAQS